MKLYISSDMEGVAGVCAWEQVDARTPHPDFAIYRRYYTREVTSAIEGARAGGATDVLVNDSHGPMRNLLLDELPNDVRVIFGNRKPFSMVQDADSGFRRRFLRRLPRCSRRCRCRALPHLHALGHLRGSDQRRSLQRGNAQRRTLGLLRRSALARHRRPHDGRGRPSPNAVGARRRRERIDRQSCREFDDAGRRTACDSARRRGGRPQRRSRRSRSASSRRSRSTCSSSRPRRRISLRPSPASSAPARAASASCTTNIRSSSKPSSPPGASARSVNLGSYGWLAT